MHIVNLFHSLYVSISLSLYIYIYIYNYVCTCEFLKTQIPVYIFAK